MEIDKIYQGDSLDVLKTFEDNSVDCCVTSPPYYALRDYGVDGQIGLEETPEKYIERLTEVFMEVHRVLKPNGTLWLNIGDSYNGSGGNHKEGQKNDTGFQGALGVRCGGKGARVNGLKPKDLIGIPWALATSLRNPFYKGKIKKESDRRWLSAIIDGEGCITGTLHTRKDGSGERTSIFINVTNSNIDLLNECERIYPFGKRLIHQKNGKEHLGEKEIFRWNIFGCKAMKDLLQELYPYLIAKKTQCLLAYNFCLIQETSKKDGHTPKKEEVNKKRKLLISLISLLNKGEKIEIPDWCIEPPTLYTQGWYLRQDIIWCLSGGTYVWVKGQKGVSPMMIKDLVRLNPSTIKLWNGEKWVNVLGYGESNDANEKIEIVLRSGERIGCTGGHKWVLKDGQEVLAKNLKVGDVLKTCTLPDSYKHTPSFMTKDLLWFLGLYLAEGSLTNDTIQISLNADEKDWVDKIDGIAKHFGGTCSHTIEGNKLNVRVYSQVLFATLHQYIGGRTAKNKHLNNVCWSMPNDWLKKIVKGYFDGDGHYDKDNNRIRLGFTRNYDLERDLRVLASRLGAELTLSLSNSKIGDKSYPSFRGEWRWVRSEHHNSKEKSEIVAIRKSRARHFYDISVDSDDHLFSLASGVLTHNCKPNPMPESVTDRCTKSHEYIFLMSKSERYYFNYEEIQEPCVNQERTNFQSGSRKNGINKDRNDNDWGERSKSWIPKMKGDKIVRNKRDVWMVNPKPNKEAHFATYPQELVSTCVLAGCPEDGIVLDPFMGSGTTGIVANKLNRHYVGIELNPEYVEMAERRIGLEKSQLKLF